MFRSLRRLALFGAMALVGALWSTDASAQVTTGAIGGRVTDEAGTNLEGVQIQLRNSLTGATRTGITSAAGTYLVLGLEIGAGYDVTARRIGFEPITKRDQNVTIGQTTRVDFQMTTRVTVLQGQVIVSEIDPVITATRTGIGSTVSDSALQRLPTLGRNFTDFVALTPQISNSGPGLSGGGANNRYNNIQIDGATESDLFGLGSTGQPGGQARGKSIGIDAVKQYQVLLSPFDVRYGNFAGALINAVTKNGTNQLQGSAYVFYRDQSTTRSQPYLNDFEQQQYGMSLGGPIIKDKVHFFVNAELQAQKAPASGPFVGLAGATNLPDTATIRRYNDILDGYGLPRSSGASRVNENPLANVFVRFDIQDLPFNSSLVVRHNYGEAQDDIFSRSFTGTNFQLLNNGYTFTSRKGGSVVQLRSNFSNGWFNEVFAGLTTIRDRRTPNVGGLPMVTTTMGGYNIISGAERFSHGNELDQDIVELTNNLVIPMGKHRFTVGASYSTYKARNLFAQSIFGVWAFDTEADFAAGNARQYIVGVPVCPPSDPGCDGAVRFKSSLFSTYVQDDWNATPWLNVQFGVRYDAPSFTDKPPTNPTVLADFGRNTADVPSGNGTVSPRIGFNWDITHDQRNQLRGGFGLFTGRPAYVWLGNSFQNSGMGGVGVLTCNPVSGTNPNGGAPVFNAANIANAPQQCAGGLSPALGAEINLLSEDLKFPQNARASLGYDRDLGNGLILTGEVLFTQAVNALFYQNIALGDPLGTDRLGRLMYGTAPLTPNLRVPGRTTVLDVENQSRDRSWQYTAGVQRRWRDNWEGSVFYTFSRVRDVQSLASSTAFSQYRFGRPAGYFPQDFPELGRSLFEQPHKIVASGTYTFNKTGTDVSVIYFGESGQRFHYLAAGNSGDLNGDGITNDLIYIPNDVNDPNEIIWAGNFSVGGVTYTPAQQAASFDRFIEGNACLNNQRGRIMAKHSCAEPWRNTVNVSVRQSIGRLGLGNALNTNTLERLTVQLDIFNFANFINRDWGQYQSVGQPGGVFGGLEYVSKEAGSMVGSTGARARFRWNPNSRFTNAQNVTSNYRMQISMRYSF
jgi:hypothetical protein